MWRNRSGGGGNREEKQLRCIVLLPFLYLLFIPLLLCRKFLRGRTQKNNFSPKILLKLSHRRSLLIEFGFTFLSVCIFRSSYSTTSDLRCGSVPVYTLFSVYLRELVVWRRTRLYGSLWWRALPHSGTWNSSSSGWLPPWALSMFKQSLHPFHPALWWRAGLS